MTMTTNLGSGAGAATVSDADQKNWTDFLGGLLPGIAGAVAPSLGIDPRVAGQTVSQVLSIFGIGGPGKAFAPALPKEQATAQLQQIIGPHLNDPVFAAALTKWLMDAVEPVQAHKQGKAYKPSVDLSKDWFSDAIDWVGGAVDTVGDALSGVNWGQVAQTGMQALPFILSLI